MCLPTRPAARPAARIEAQLQAPLRTVLVTGGTGAIGGAIVAALCRQNTGAQTRGAEAAGAETPSANALRWRVVAGYARDDERARAVREATGCEIHRADVGDEAEVEAMFGRWPEPFAVVHAAAVSRNALLGRQTRAEWRETLRVNADGAFLVTRAALSNLRDGGRLLLLASRVGERGSRGQGAYAASKAACLALMRCAAREGAVRGISVNAICPGFVPSALTRSLPAQRLEQFRRDSVLGRFGSPREVAATVLWLLREDAAAVSGQVIHCDSRIA